jgi:hypothetical protein
MIIILLEGPVDLKEGSYFSIAFVILPGQAGGL